MQPYYYDGGWSPNYVSTLFSNCIKSKNLNLGRNLHSLLIKTSLILDTFLVNRLIQMYSSCNSINSSQKAFDDHPFKSAQSWNILISAYSQKGHFVKARQVLDKMPEPNLVSYNSMISSFCRGGFFLEAVGVFKKMQGREQSGVLIDEFTVVGLSNACASLGALGLLRQIHCVAVVMGLDFNGVVCNAMIDAYAKCGLLEMCCAIFSRMEEEKTVFSWTSMVVAYASADRMEDACCLFERMPVKNVVSWSALITGLVRNGDGERALLFFTKMLDEGVVPNDFTYVSALTTCADLALSATGKQMHCRIIRNQSGRVFDSVFIVNALIDMYSKCGDMISSMRLFERLDKKDIVSWNSMITSLAQHGHGDASLAIFERMTRAHVRPNHVTFTGMLSACNHAGLESEGLRFLDMMEKDFGLIPRLEHYSILVDLLGRKNRLTEAQEVIEKSPYNGLDCMRMWGSLLGACRIHGNLEVATRAAEELFKLEPQNTGRYVILSNVYAAAGRWEDARRVRSMMEGMDLKKDAGCSWVEINNSTRHVFVAENIAKSMDNDLHELLLTLVDQMKGVGHILPNEKENGLPSSSLE